MTWFPGADYNEGLPAPRRHGGIVLEKKRRYGSKPREDKDVLKQPRCPFCRQPFARPETVRTELGSFLGGRCSCGAVFACDETGKNLGEVHMDALVYACGGDWDRALGLVPGEDFDEEIFEYRSQPHTVPVVKKPGGFGFSEKVLFIKIR